jgi:hypothetical protein
MYRKLIILLIIAFTSVNGQTPNIPNCVIDSEKYGLKVTKCISNRITHLSKEGDLKKIGCCSAIFGYECWLNVLEEKCRDQMGGFNLKNFHELLGLGNSCDNFDENQCNFSTATNFSIGLVPSIMVFLIINTYSRILLNKIIII